MVMSLCHRLVVMLLLMLLNLSCCCLLNPSKVFHSDLHLSSIPSLSFVANGVSPTCLCFCLGMMYTSHLDVSPKPYVAVLHELNHLLLVASQLQRILGLCF